METFTIRLQLFSTKIHSWAKAASAKTCLLSVLRINLPAKLETKLATFSAGLFFVALLFWTDFFAIWWRQGPMGYHFFCPQVQWGTPFLIGLETQINANLLPSWATLVQEVVLDELVQYVSGLDNLVQFVSGAMCLWLFAGSNLDSTWRHLGLLWCKSWF